MSDAEGGVTVYARLTMSKRWRGTLVILIAS